MTPKQGWSRGMEARISRADVTQTCQACGDTVTAAHPAGSHSWLSCAVKGPALIARAQTLPVPSRRYRRIPSHGTRMSLRGFGVGFGGVFTYPKRSLCHL